MVDEFAVCQLAAALGMSEPAARAYVGQALELRDRLPRLWARVMGGELPAWKARQVAAETIPLNAAAAAYVDAHLAPFAAKMSLHRILRCVHAAIAAARPCAGRRASRQGRRRPRGVDRRRPRRHQPDHRGHHHPRRRGVRGRGPPGRRRPRRPRVHRARAGPPGHRGRGAGRPAVRPGSAQPPLRLLLRRRSQPGEEARRDPTIHIHLHTDAINGVVPAADADGVSRTWLASTSRGPRSIDAIQQWLAGLAPGHSVKVTPVVDLTEHSQRRRLRGPRPAPEPGRPPRRRLPVPLVRPAGALRRRPHRPLRPDRRRRTTGPDQHRQHREALPVPPPCEDPRPMAISPRRPTSP